MLNLRKDSEWEIIEDKLCKAANFVPLMGSEVRDGKVISPVTSEPYASVDIECPELNEDIKGFITHKIDFSNLWEVFNNQFDKNKYEVLFFWTRNFYQSRLSKLFSLASPKMIILICNKRPLDNFKLSHEHDLMVYVYGLMPIKYLIPEVIHKA